MTPKNPKKQTIVYSLSIIKISHAIFGKWNFDIHNLLKILTATVYSMSGFFVGKGLNSSIKVQNYPIFTEKNDVILNVTKVKYTVNFQIMPFMVQNKTQIASNTHRYKKIVKKILTWKSNHTYKLIYQKVSHVIFLIKKLSYKENWASNTQEQVWRALLSWLYHYSSIDKSVSCPNQSFYKYDFLKKSMITLLSKFSVTT